MTELLSVGLDVGTTTTQMILSRLTVENQSSGFAVPEMVIRDRQILYKSPVHFTPLVRDELIDGQALRKLVEDEYKNAGIRPEQVDTGAVIVTGETSRKENAGQVLQNLSDMAGDFVVATAGPDLESVLAAKGSGAVGYSEETGKPVLHMDIGGGTSNLALLQDGKVLQTGCLNVGGRLIKLDKEGVVTYCSPVVQDLTDLKVGEKARLQQIEQLAETLVQALEMAAGLRPANALLQKLTTKQNQGLWKIPEQQVVLSFSGGVADCIEKEHPPFAFGDLGPVLGKAIKNSALCGTYRLGQETIRATVIGAGCHSTRLSGSTVFCQNVKLPKKNMQVLQFTAQQQKDSALPDLIRSKMAVLDESDAVLAFPGLESPTYEDIGLLADRIAEGLQGKPAYIALKTDMAKALGQKLSLLMGENTPCLCLDRLSVGPESYLDIGQPVGPSFPVVIKTLVLSGK